MRSLVLSTMLLTPMLAMAADPSFTHQARLLDAGGTPIEGTHATRLTLYTAEMGGTDCWQTSFPTVQFNNGYFAVEASGLDATNRDLGSVADTCRWMGVALDLAPDMTPRQRVADFVFGSLNLGSANLDEATVNALLAPTPLFPVEGASVGTLRPTFDWGGPGPFTIEVATAAEPSTVVWTDTAALGTITVDTDLSPDTDYVWRVISTVGGNSASSADRTFSTGVAPLFVTTSLVADSNKSTMNTTASAGTTSLPVTNGSVFATGDRVLVIDLQGTAAGTFEFATLAGVSGNTLTLTSGLQFSYPGTTDRVVVQKAIHGDGITVTGSVTASAWDGTSGGVVAMYSEGDLTISPGGSINVDGLGFQGGAKRGLGCPGGSLSTYSTQGETYSGPGVQSRANNNGAGGGGRDGCQTCTSGGGGAGHLSAGSSSVSNSATCTASAGQAYGTNTRFSALFGSGGGGGRSSGNGPSTDGGDGGGIVLLFAQGTVNVAANTITASGNAPTISTYQGGGGSGGTVLIVAPVITAGAISVNGGSPPSGGAASAGRLKTFTETP